MISASYLDSIADEMDALYSQLHQDILKDIARRVKKTGVLTGTAGWQIEMLKQQGLLKTDIINTIAKYTNLSTGKVRTLFKDAMMTGLNGDKVVYAKLGASPSGLLESSNSYRALLAGLSRTNATLENLTGVLSNSSAGLLQEVCNRAYMQVQSGAFTYEQASAFASDELIKLDKDYMTYSESGRRVSIEAGVRRAIVTGVNQTACQLMLGVAQDLGTNVVETTAHYGARPSHQVWQGQLFEIEGDKKYPNLYTATGYGSVDGLAGANCRHDFHPYFEGISEPQYGKEQLDKWDNDKVTFNGKEMTYYDATQKMRGYERSIRGIKKEKGVYETFGADTSKHNSRLKEYSKKAKFLNEETGVPLDYSRRRIARY